MSSNHERVKRQAIAKGKEDAAAGFTCNSMAKDGSMYDKYYWYGYDGERRRQSLDTPLKDDHIEAIAHEIAEAINAGDGDRYARVMAESKTAREGLDRPFGILEFKARVHFIADSKLKLMDQK